MAIFYITIVLRWYTIAFTYPFFESFIEIPSTWLACKKWWLPTYSKKVQFSHVDNANKVVSESPGTQDHHLAHTFFDHHTCALIALIHLSGIVFANGGSLHSAPGDHKCLLFHGLLDVWTIMNYLFCWRSLKPLRVTNLTSTGSVFCDPAGVVWNWLRRHHQSAGNKPNTNQLATGCWCSSMISTIKLAGYRDEQLVSRQGHGMAWLTTVEDLFRRLKTTAAASTSESDLRFSDVYPILRSCPCTLSILILWSATRSVSVFRIPEVAPVGSPSRILCSQIGACTSGMEQLHHLHLITSSISVVEGGATIQRPRLHLGVQVTVWYRNCMEISIWVEVVSLKSVYPYTPQKKTYGREPINCSTIPQISPFLICWIPPKNTQTL